MSSIFTRIFGSPADKFQQTIRDITKDGLIKGAADERFSEAGKLVRAFEKACHAAKNVDELGKLSRAMETILRDVDFDDRSNWGLEEARSRAADIYAAQKARIEAIDKLQKQMGADTFEAKGHGK